MQAGNKYVRDHPDEVWIIDWWKERANNHPKGRWKQLAAVVLLWGVVCSRVLVSITTSRSKADSPCQWSNWKGFWLQFVRLSPSLLVSGGRWWRGADKYCKAVLRHRLHDEIDRIKGKYGASNLDILLFFILFNQDYTYPCMNCIACG